MVRVAGGFDLPLLLVQIVFSHGPKCRGVADGLVSLSSRFCWHGSMPEANSVLASSRFLRDSARLTRDRARMRACAASAADRGRRGFQSFRAMRRYFKAATPRRPKALLSFSPGFASERLCLSVASVGLGPCWLCCEANKMATICWLQAHETIHRNTPAKSDIEGFA